MLTPKQLTQNMHSLELFVERARKMRNMLYKYVDSNTKIIDTMLNEIMNILNKTPVLLNNHHGKIDEFHAKMITSLNVMIPQLEEYIRKKKENDFIKPFINLNEYEKEFLRKSPKHKEIIDFNQEEKIIKESKAEPQETEILGGKKKKTGVKTKSKKKSKSKLKPKKSKLPIHKQYNVMI